MFKNDGATPIKPVTDEYIRKMAGITGTKGKLLNALMKEKAKERERPSGFESNEKPPAE